eukprot:6336979-Amphidinium_carterae.1
MPPMAPHVWQKNQKSHKKLHKGCTPSGSHPGGQRRQGHLANVGYSKPITFYLAKLWAKSLLCSAEVLQKDPGVKHLYG